MTETQTTPPPRPSPVREFFASRGWRFSMMILLTLVMGIPLLMVAALIADRTHYQDQAVHEVSRQWGGPIRLAGPAMVIPVEAKLTRTVKGKDGEEHEEVYRALVDPVVLLPESLSVTADAKSQIRRRGIFEVPVYSTDFEMVLAYDTARIANEIGPRETVLWDRASLALLMPGTRSFSGKAVLQVGETTVDLEPGTPFSGQPGIQARLGDPRGLAAVRLTMGLNGAQHLRFSPVARQTEVTMTSDWPHPSFNGAFLPRDREITDAGFTAKWSVPHLARDMAQVSRGAWRGGADFGVSFYNPVDFYQKVERAAKYGILFIALTFLTVFLIERFATRPAHAAQFVLIGIAQCIFFLLLLSFAEQIGFTPAYLVASGATIGLIGVYGRSGLGLGRRSLVLVGCLVTLYATLYLILRSTDYALLAGSVLAFIAVAAAMMMTRGEDWSGNGRVARPA